MKHKTSPAPDADCSVQPRQHRSKADPLAVQLAEKGADEFGLPKDGSATVSRSIAAEYIGVSERGLDRLLDAGEFRYVGSTKRIAKLALFRYVHDTAA